MKHTITNLTRTFVAALLFVTFSHVNAQQEPFTRTDAMIPMRDGVRLNTHVYSLSRATEKFPILLLRTPYGIGDLSSAQLAAVLPELTADGYIIVQQDIRGRFKSEGQFVMLRQPRDPKDKTPSTKALTLTTRLNGS
jgi:predicted acyl esterase